MENYWLYLTILLLHVSLTNAICDSKCSSIRDLLSKCSLPPLSTEFGSVDDPETRPQNDSPFGPATYFIDSVEKASCFCSTARDSFEDCRDCFDDNGGSKQNDAEIVKLYQGDCLEFGYFVNETLSYPSTTRDAMPSSTASASDDAKCTDTDTCGVVRNQVAECSLTSFDEVDASKNMEDYFDKLLLNRTAAECFCTEPVLERLFSCSSCLGKPAGKSGRREANIHFGIVREYSSQCFKFGYYADSKVGQSGGSNGASQTSGAAGPANTDKPEEDVAATLWDHRALFLLGICCGLSLLRSLI
jgi:hypothetical protein